MWIKPQNSTKQHTMAFDKLIISKNAFLKIVGNFLSKPSHKTGRVSITEGWPDNTPSTLASTSLEQVSRSMPLRHSEETRQLSWRRREPQMCAWTLGSTKLLGPKEKRTPHTWSMCSRPENVMKRHQASLHVRTYVPVTAFKNLQTMQMRTNCWYSKAIEPSKKKVGVENHINGWKGTIVWWDQLFPT